MNMENKKLLNNVKINARNRIIELIQEYCDGSQQHFVEKTGLNKGAVSQYVNGKKAPTNLAAQTIAKAFNVSPPWVMGFDVPKEPLPKMIISKDDIELVADGSNGKVLAAYMRTATEAGLRQLEVMSLLNMELIQSAQDCTPEQIHIAIDMLNNFKALNKAATVHYSIDDHDLEQVNELKKQIDENYKNGKLTKYSDEIPRDT